jgi:hypothetical protein
MAMTPTERSRKYRAMRSITDPSDVTMAQLVELLKEENAYLRAQLSTALQTVATVCNVCATFVQRSATVDATVPGFVPGTGPASARAPADTFSSSLSLSDQNKKPNPATEFQDLEGKTREHVGHLKTGIRVPGRLGDDESATIGNVDATLRNGQRPQGRRVSEFPKSLEEIESGLRMKPMKDHDAAEKARLETERLWREMGNGGEQV